jgi:hypothetical protein
MEVNLNIQRIGDETLNILAKKATCLNGSAEEGNGTQPLPCCGPQESMQAKKNPWNQRRRNLTMRL